MKRTCSRCNITYSLESKYFHRKKRNCLGFNTICKVCINASDRNRDRSVGIKLYYSKNRETILANKSKYYLENKDEIRRKQLINEVNREREA